MKICTEEGKGGRGWEGQVERKQEGRDGAGEARPADALSSCVIGVVIHTYRHMGR